MKSEKGAHVQDVVDSVVEKVVPGPQALTAAATAEVVVVGVDLLGLVEGVHRAVSAVGAVVSHAWRHTTKVPRREGPAACLRNLRRHASPH